MGQILGVASKREPPEATAENRCLVGGIGINLPAVSAKDEIVTAATKKNDREKVKAFLRRMSMEQRMESIVSELIWHLNAGGKSAVRQKRLPEYCYNIFDKYQRTILKILPKLHETVKGDGEGSKQCKTACEAKQLIKVDWLRLGRVFGFLLRAKRYVALESAGEIKGLDLFAVDSVMQKENIQPRSQAPQKKSANDASAGKSKGSIWESWLRNKTEAELQSADELLASINHGAFEWGPAAMAHFNRGMAEGLESWIGENRKFAGETSRANIYWLLLLGWPEIREMLEAKPKKTITDLWTWMLPFTREGDGSAIDLDTLRDVCEPVRYGGIALSLRPLSSRSAKSSD